MEVLIRKEKISEKQVLDSSIQEKIPLIIFRGELSGLEAITKYLRENEKKSYKEMSFLTGRKIGTLASTYKKAREKKPGFYEVTEHDYKIPLGIIRQHYSVLESICFYLKEQGLRKIDIARALNKDPRTVWTVINRIKGKIQ